MRKVIVPNTGMVDFISFHDINPSAPIFAVRGGKLAGMVVKEEVVGTGWILRTGGSFEATGHHPTLLECIESCINSGYSFVVDVDGGDE